MSTSSTVFAVSDRRPEFVEQGSCIHAISIQRTLFPHKNSSDAHKEHISYNKMRYIRCTRRTNVTYCFLMGNSHQYFNCALGSRNQNAAIYILTFLQSYHKVPLGTSIAVPGDKNGVLNFKVSRHHTPFVEAHSHTLLPCLVIPLYTKGKITNWLTLCVQASTSSCCSLRDSTC